MKVERLLQINIAAMAALSTLLLGFGKGNFMFTIVAIFAAFTSVLFTDVLGWFKLHRYVANLAAMVAALWVLVDFGYRGRGLDQLASISNLLISLQIVLLYQAKSPRIYWQLAVLSLLQVVVASALSSGLMQGVLLVGFMLLSLTALTLFFVLREARCGVAPDPPEGEESAAPAGLAATAYAMVNPESNAGRLLTPRLFRQTVLICLLAVSFSAVMFYTAPRFGGSGWRSSGGGRGQVGFSDGITFDEVDRLLESNRLMMRVEYYNAKTGEPYPVLGDVYLRGAVLTRYENFRGSPGWKPIEGRDSGTQLRQAEDEDSVVKQVISLSPSGTSTLFTLSPTVAVEETPEEIRFDPRRQRLFRDKYNESEQAVLYRYVTGVTSFREGLGVQAVITPNNEFVNLGQRLPPRADTRSQAVFNWWQMEQAYPEVTTAITKLADEVLQEAGLNKDSPTIKRAEALSSYFERSGKYFYALDLRDVPRDRSLDPVVDFAVNHRTGYCVHFASALALMLRSQDIPSRIVMGFRASQFNTLGGFYQVLDRDAHAWVEAYLEPDEVDERRVARPGTTAHGGWLRLDPTPSTSRRVDKEETGLTAAVGDTLDYMRFLWSDYVVGLTPQKQQNLYSPVSDNKNFFAALFMGKLFQNWGLDFWNWNGRRWFSWEGFLITFVLLTVCTGIYRVGGMLLPRIQAMLSRQGESNAASQRLSPVQFYRRLDQLLAAAGFPREAGVTPRERAQTAGENWPVQAYRQQAPALLADLLAVFYRVRFGNAPLEGEAATRVDQLIDQLEGMTQSPAEDPA